MKVSDNGVNFVKRWEGLYLKAYQDIVGVWTIGYGHTKGVKPSDRLANEQEAHEILKEDLQSHMWKADSQITVELTQNQYDAIVSFCFNLGANILTGSSLLSYINNEQWQQASNEMLDYCHAGGKFVQGLYNRRKAEAELFMTNVGVSRETLSYDSSWFTNERGTFVSCETIKVRNIPSVNGEHLRTLNSESSYMYDGYGIEKDGYVWLRGVDGTYLASGETKDGKRVNSWGVFK